MTERDLWWKIVGIAALVALAVATIYPPKEKLKYGIDLYGGYSLTYEIDDSGMSAGERMGLSERVIKVLKERIDPNQVFNLVWRPIGHNRLEIQMPRPSDEVRTNREAYEKEQAIIAASHVRRSEIMRAVARSGADREAAINSLVRGIESRRPLLVEAAKAHDAHRTTQAEFDARVAALKTDNLTAADVEAALSKPVAERAAALTALVRTVPARQALLDDAAKTWDALEAARPTTQPVGDVQPTKEVVDAFEAKQRSHQSAMSAVLAANVDPNNFKDGVTINDVVAQEEKLEKAIADVMATNFDISALQVALEAKPQDAQRKEALAKITSQYPGLSNNISALVKASDSLKRRRRGEGRLEDPADLQRLLKGTGVLEFRILAERGRDDPAKFDPYVNWLKEHGPRPKPGEDQFQWFEIEDPKDMFRNIDLQRDFDNVKLALPGGVVVERFGDKFFVLAHVAEGYTLVHKAGSQEWRLVSARPDLDENGRQAMSFVLDERGGSRFYALTTANLKRQLSIFLDDKCISHATINSAIRTNGQIMGQFTRKDVEEMSRKLNAGSLPKKLKDPPISVRSIGSTLGEENAAKGLKAAIYGSLVVAVFMLFFYYYTGAIAIIAVGINTLFVLASMAIMGATLTMAGIAGLVLSIGMGVDTNVLINERKREELAKGAILRMAIKLGYERAFSAIFDSHLTTLLTCAILYFLGSEDVKGFGLTLGIGVLVNLFTAYTVTRIYFEVMSLPRLPTEVERYPWLISIGVTVLGAVFYGLAIATTDVELRDQSSLFGLGRGLLLGGPVMIAFLLTVWGARWIHRSQQTGGVEHLPMRKMISVPNIDWCSRRHVFYGVSIVGTVLGAILFFRMPDEQLYDIEFLGGTSAQIDLKTPGSMTVADVRGRLEKSAETIDKYAESLKSASVSGSGDTYKISSPGVPAGRLDPIVRAVLDAKDKKELSEVSPVTYADPMANELTVRTKVEANLNANAMQDRLKALSTRMQTAADSIREAQVTTADNENKAFKVTTRETSKDVVVSAIMETLRDQIDVQPSLTFKLAQSPSGSFFPIRSEKASEIGLPLPPNEANLIDLQGWRGGVALVLEELQPPQSVDAVKKRLRSMRFQPGFEQSGWRESEVVGLTSADPTAGTYKRMVVLVSDENYTFETGGEPSPQWLGDFAEKEVKLTQTALERQTSLSEITQFDHQVSDEAALNAKIALVLSWLGIIIYLWFRFGNARWGLAAVAALVHDIFIVCLFIGLAHLLAESFIGKALMLQKFRIDLTMVAAFLTIIGYSVSDTIVVYDRIRENRGRSRDVTVKMVNDSINQTLSRTLLTGMTTLGTSIVMYIFGGEGIHGFNYAMIIGILTGTYSSFAIAGQLLLSRAARETYSATAPAAA